MRDAGFGHVSIMTCELSQTPSPRMAQVAYILHEPSPTVCLVLGVYFFYYGMAAFAPVFGFATGVARGALKTRNWAATGGERRARQRRMYGRTTGLCPLPRQPAR